MTPFDAMIFDCDGTLVDSLQDITDALNHGLKRLQRPAIEPAQARRWIGDGLPSLCRRAAPDLDGESLARFIGDARSAYQTSCVRHTGVYPNILKTLELLKLAGLRIGVLSNKPQDLLIRVLEAVALAPLLSACIGYTDEQSKKPSPRAAISLAARWGVSPNRVLLVGDSPVDVQTARNAGMAAAAVTWGFRDREELIAAGPDYLVDRPEQLRDLTAPTTHC